MKVGIVSGYFNPIHLGHIDYINAAKEKCDYLMVIVNNDDQVKLKNTIPFMDEWHRCEIIRNLKSVDDAIISRDYTCDVCKTIEYIKSEFPNDELTFFNSGDRIGNNIDSSERILCQSLGINFLVLPLPKKYSSSDLIKNAAIEIVNKQ